MESSEFRRVVVTTLRRIETSLNGVPGDQRNRGLSGAVEELLCKVEYEETQRKTDVLPRLSRLADRLHDAEHKHDKDLAKQKSWRNGLTFALGIVSGILAMTGFLRLF